LQLALDLGENVLFSTAEAEQEVSRERDFRQISARLSRNRELNRSLVSFQASKAAPFYRWFKYREAFSSEFVEYVLDKFAAQNLSGRRTILDPFAGSGTTLMAAARRGFDATGIEILPIGISILRAREAADSVEPGKFEREVRRLKGYPLLARSDHHFPHLRITEGAFSGKTEAELSGFFEFLGSIRDESVHDLFHFACLSLLEDISFTRKDGQYLRWDRRSGRKLKSNFSKGEVADFRSALLSKLELMLLDIRNQGTQSTSPRVNMCEGSCLERLPRLPNGHFDLVLTSPPYCNRYDYTRTYALELAFLGLDDRRIKELRQRLLSCTVENRSKEHALATMYGSMGELGRFESAMSAFNRQHLLGRILKFLMAAKDKGELNNNNIPSLVKNYFLEMNLVVHELARVLAPGGIIVMVNDNVQYQGREVPVDLILGDFAVAAGLEVKHIWVLPRGKGNSSQQMGAFGRREIRKCVYVWSKPMST
jgi:DNA modification methylase